MGAGGCAGSRESQHPIFLYFECYIKDNLIVGNSTVHA